MENRIDYSVEDHIARVHLIRGDKMNALDADMMDALIEAGERVKADDSIRVVVISGEGKAFCAGLDMGNFAKMAGGGDAGVTNGGARQLLAERTHGLANRPQMVAYTWREIKVPVLAAAQGFALGGGFQIFMGADMRYAAPGTKFSIMESRLVGKPANPWRKRVSLWRQVFRVHLCGAIKAAAASMSHWDDCRSSPPPHHLPPIAPLHLPRAGPTT